MEYSAFYVAIQFLPSRTVVDNGTCRQITVDVHYYAMQIFPHTYVNFEDANCVHKDKNILFSIKLDTSICVPQFYHVIIII
jgi:hypothetical protein